MFVFLKIWRALFSWDSFWDSPFCLITNELFEFVAKSSCFLISFNKTTTKNFEIQPNECFSFSFCNVEQVILNGFTNRLALIPFSQYLNSHIAWFKLIKHLFLKRIMSSNLIHKLLQMLQCTLLRTARYYFVFVPI